MKKLILIISVLFSAFAAFAQTESEVFEQRYNMLVSKVGADGLGVETVLNSWAEVDSTNANMLLGRFQYYFTKSQTSDVVTKTGRKYLGLEPIHSLKDSLGNDVHYYQEYFYDDELYGKAIRFVDQAIALYPDRLDLRYVKANAYIAYEKESPDMVLVYLQDLLKEYASSSRKWIFNGEEVNPAAFQGDMQNYCFSLYTIGTDTAFEAFRKFSESLSKQYPSNMEYVNNMGSYYMAKQDYKTALKYYDKVLKKLPSDNTAMQNALLAARKMQNVKLEKKYLQQMVKYGSQKEKLMAEARLSYLNK